MKQLYVASKFKNATGRLLSMTNGFNETTSLAYDAYGRVSRKTVSSGQYEEFTYDALHRVSQIALKTSAHAVLRTQSYTYDWSSKIMSHTVSGVTTSYAYDPAGQLISESRPGYSGTYTYDANGNRLTRTVNGVQEVYAYDDGDKLLNVKVNGAVVKNFAYDLAGRTTGITTSAGTTTFTYDYESRATSVTSPGMAQTNVYNGLDTRVGSTTNNVANSYLRDGAYVTDAVLKDSTATFTPGVSERRGSVTTFSHSGLKNADAQTGVNQAVNATQQYDAFGNLTSSTGTWQGQFGYGGGFGYQQDATGLKLLGHRYYDSSTGRFLTRDPIKDGRNWYGYVGNDPVNRSDSAGLSERALNPAETILVKEAIAKVREAGMTTIADQLDDMLKAGDITSDPSLTTLGLTPTMGQKRRIILGQGFFNRYVTWRGGGYKYDSTGVLEGKVANAGVLVHELTHVYQHAVDLISRVFQGGGEPEAYDKEREFYKQWRKRNVKRDKGGFVQDLIDDATTAQNGN